MRKKITCGIYKRMKPLLISPMDDALVADKFGFGERTVRDVRRSECFEEYQERQKVKQLKRMATLNRITETCKNAICDRQNLKYAAKKRVVERIIRDGVLKFRDKNTIEMHYDHNYKTIFLRHRGRGVYANNWRPFRKALSEAKPMDTRRVWRLANQFDIDHITRRTGENHKD